ncbi:hypothetical protein ACFYVR_23705 [Rhodococcus sp. NPDC003318]|uniref:hypothetical protein n=1 Tax=Rhodococcus sp. NPDC003318 TaxID=3364503 RepID=UPI0036A18CBE
MQGRNRVDDLTVGENVTVPMKMVREVTGWLGDTGADDELQPGLVERLQVAGGKHAGIGGDDHLHTGDIVTVLVLADYRSTGP